MDPTTLRRLSPVSWHWWLGADRDHEHMVLVGSVENPDIVSQDPTHIGPRRGESRLEVVGPWQGSSVPERTDSCKHRARRPTRPLNGAESGSTSSRPSWLGERHKCEARVLLVADSGSNSLQWWRRRESNTSERCRSGGNPWESGGTAGNRGGVHFPQIPAGGRRA